MILINQIKTAFFYTNLKKTSLSFFKKSDNYHRSYFSFFATFVLFNISFSNVVLNKIIIIFAVFMLLRPISPILEYIVFYDYIKTELCENRANITMHCDGKCYLAKQLAKSVESENKSEEKRQISIEIVFVYFQEITSNFIAQNFIISTITKVSNYHEKLYSHLGGNRMLRPPIN